MRISIFWRRDDHSRDRIRFDGTILAKASSNAFALSSLSTPRSLWFFGTARIALFYLASPLPLAWRLLPYGLSVVSLPVGQSLSDDALNGPFGSLNVVYAQPDPIGIAEIELREIAVQMLLFAVLVDAFHATLENRVVALDGVGVDVAANVFVNGVVDGFMAGKFPSDPRVPTGIVRHQRRVALDVFVHGLALYRRGAYRRRGNCGHRRRAGPAS